MPPNHVVLNPIRKRTVFITYLMASSASMPVFKDTNPKPLLLPKSSRITLAEMTVPNFWKSHLRPSSDNSLPKFLT